MLLLFGIFLVSQFSTIAVHGQCPPLGSTLPSPRQVSDDATVKEVAAEMSLVLQNVTATWNATAISVIGGSFSDATPFLEFSNAPTSFNSSGSHTVDANTSFIIASISKLFTALGVLQLNDRINLADSITKYTAEEDGMLFFAQGTCQSWATLSVESYGRRPLDQFVLTMGNDGVNVEVDARAWRTVMSRAA
ncbi:hypothetical protein MBLNU459_g5823t2 [Dothideomycetes sp. NU459]